MKKTTHLDGPPGAFKRAKFWVQAVRMLVVPLVGKKIRSETGGLRSRI